MITIKRFFLKTLFLFWSEFVFAQIGSELIKTEDVSRILNFLSSDSMRGRGNGSKELFTTAKFIGSEFKKAGLSPLTGQPSFYLSFFPFEKDKPFIKDKLVWNEKYIPDEQFLYFQSDPGYFSEKRLSEFKILKEDSAITEDILVRYDTIRQDLLIWSSFKQRDNENYFPPVFKLSTKGLNKNVLLVYTDINPVSGHLYGQQDYYSSLAYNVVGILPGRSRASEVILFSSHYDHLGIDKEADKDSIFNGANDNASGVTALIALANYYAKRNDNERTLIFCAFAGEELGLLGSKDFLKYIFPQRISAMINIEMIGIPQFGKKTIFFNGENYSNLPSLLKKELAGIKVIKDFPRKQLFKRSDNFFFAQKGIPAHTIMASNDDDKCYHQPCDEVKRIDIVNMAAVINAIAKGCERLISGEDTPSRIDPAVLY